MSTDITGLIQEAWAAQSRGETNDTTQYILDRLPDDEREAFDRAITEVEESVRSITAALATAYGQEAYGDYPKDRALQAEMIAARHVIAPKPLLYMLDELEIAPEIVDLFAAMADYGIGEGPIIAAAQAMAGMTANA